MKRKILFIFLLLIGVGLVVFYIYMRGHVRIEPQAPAITSFSGFSDNELSTLTFPVSINLQDVADKLNDKLDDKPIVAHIPIDDGAGTLDLKMIFFDEIKLFWENQKMKAIVPLEIGAVVDTRRMGIRLHNETPVNARVSVTMEVDPDLVKGWELKCRASLQDIKWLKKPSLNFGKIKIDLTAQVEKQLDEHRDRIEKAVEKRINKALRIHDVIEKLWNDIQRPILVNKKGLPLFLKIIGTDLSAKWIKEATVNPTIMVSVRGYYELTAGEGNFGDTTRTMLPDFEELKGDDPGIFAHINARIPYKEIMKLIMPKLDSLKLEYAEFKIRIKEFEIYGGDSLVIFRVGLRGDISGSIYMKGKPQFTDMGRTITVADFNYDVYTENAMASTAEVWLHDFLLTKANEYLTLGIDSLVHKLPNAMMSGIERSKVGNKIDVAVDELFVKPLVIRSAKDHLALQLLVQGNAALRLEKDVFIKKKKIVNDNKPD